LKRGPSCGPRFDLRVAGDLAVVRRVREELRTFCKRRGVASKTVDDLLLAVTEACDNALEHGGAKGVRVLAAVRADRILVRVIGGSRKKLDSLQRGIDASHRLPPDDWERGRGLFLVRSCVDRVGVGTCGEEIEIRMTKRRRPAAPG